jgi:hypothetical protein
MATAPTQHMNVGTDAVDMERQTNRQSNRCLDQTDRQTDRQIPCTGGSNAPKVDVAQAQLLEDHGHGLAGHERELLRVDVLVPSRHKFGGHELHLAPAWHTGPHSGDKPSSTQSAIHAQHAALHKHTRQ